MPYRPPLDWDALITFLAARATPGVEVVEEGVYRRTIVAGGSRGLIAVAHEPARSRIRLTVHLPDPLALRDVVARVRRLFDLDADPPGPEVAGRRDHEPPVTRAEIVDHIARAHPGQLEHLVHHLGRGHQERGVGARMGRAAPDQEDQADQPRDRVTLHA